MTYDFTRKICFQDLNDFETPASFSADKDTGIVSLEGVTLGGLALTSEQVRDIMGAAQYAEQVAAVQEWWCADGWAAAEQDSRAYWAEAAE